MRFKFEREELKLLSIMFKNISQHKTAVQTVDAKNLVNKYLMALGENNSESHLNRDEASLLRQIIQRRLDVVAREDLKLIYGGIKTKLDAKLDVAGDARESES